MTKPKLIQTGSDQIRLEPEVERELLRAYIDSANDGIFVVCDEMKFHVANPMLVNWLGVSERELTAHGHRLPITDFFCQPDTEKLFIKHFLAVLEGQSSRFEMEIRPVHGVPRWVEISLNRVRLEGGVLVIGVVRDITERRQLQIALQHQASHDDLTGLVNRREFQLRLNMLVRSLFSEPGPHALIYIDLDQFKVVNDTCGHIAGDELLRQIGQRLGERIRARDVVARLGGDEFGVLLHDVSIDQATEVAEKLCSAVATHRFVWDDRRYDLTASIGLCAIDHETQSTEEAMSAADAACYVAKDKGRNRVHVYRADDAELLQRHGEMQWVARINHALEENRFALFRQHIVPLGDSHDRHCELLLRMVDDQNRHILPGAFIPAAERYSLMPAIDRWVVRHALEFLRDHAGSHPETYFINLSGTTVSEDQFADYVTEHLKACRLPATSIGFEITETAVIANLASATNFIEQMKRLDCRVALDDFGSGLSSFSYLKSIPADYLKIDGSFIKDLLDDPMDHAIVEAVNRIGHVAGLKTIAEFVESEPIRGRLHEIGVDYAQGYAIQRPLPFA